MALLTEVALSDMRVAGVSDYLSSYAYNDDTLRERNPSAGDFARAVLLMGRYPTPEAFTTANPDYAANLSWVDANDPMRGYTWPVLNPWWVMTLGNAYPNTWHAPGWVNNTRVMIWGVESWVKSKSSGLWLLKFAGDETEAFFQTPNFESDTGYGWTDPSLGADMRRESATGYWSGRLSYSSSTSNAPSFLQLHGWQIGATGVHDPYDVADIAVVWKTALVVHDPYIVDDRDFSRYLLRVGGDYYPGSSFLTINPGSGASKSKYVRAKWPNWQYHVMHTMTEAQFNAANGYPSAWVGLSEGDGGSGGGGGGGTPTTPPVAPTVGSWEAKTSGGADNWFAAAVANTAANKPRRRRRLSIWS